MGVASPYRWNTKGESHKFVEQRTRLHVAADFTDNVCAFIEFDSYWWGEDFRSDYITGADSRANTANDVEVYQAYIEAGDFLGMEGLRLRIGRQELALGNQWLVGPKDFGQWFVGRSFDAIRLTYATDMMSLDAFWSKLVERTLLEEDADVDLYGLYASLKPVEDMTLDAYWLYTRDARSINDTNFIAPLEWIEDAVGVDDYDVTELHTVGMRVSGVTGGFDYEMEAAYQFGEADQYGFNFKPFLYGDNGAEFDAWGCNIEFGYTLPSKWNPRLFAGYTFYEGADNRDQSWTEWVNPFDRPESSVSFNRLFSNSFASGFFDLNNDLSNCHIFRAGTLMHPTEQVHLFFELAYFLVDEPFDLPAYFTVGKARIPIAPALPFLDTQADPELGWQTHIGIIYNYTQDLKFELHWAHLFSGDGLEDGSYFGRNGTVFGGGSDSDDADFIAFETQVKF